MIIPFLGVLFGTQERVVNPPEIINSIESFKNLFYYQISHTIESSGSAKALILICSVILISFLFRNLFRYLALYFMVPIRNGVINDIRVVINKKLLSIPIKSIKKRKKGDLLSRISNDLIEIYTKIRDEDISLTFNVSEFNKKLTKSSNKIKRFNQQLKCL